MEIALNYNHLQRLAANGSVEVDGVTLTIGPPIRPFLNQISEYKEDDYVAFALDSSDPRSEPFKFKPKR